MADLLGTSVSGLLAFQRSLATTSHNISNVNTEGYSRQRAELETRTPTAQGNGFIGNGVETTTVRRLFEQSREDALRQAGSDFSRADTLSGFTGRIDNLLADKEAGLSPALQSFFDGLQDVANDPSASSARSVALAEADSLVSRFQLLDRRFSDLGGEVNSQLRGAVTEINQYAESIADLNREIRESEGRTGQPPNDLLDQRDLQIRKLSEKIDTRVVAQDNGALNVFVGSGQPLVSGDRANALGTRPDAFDAGRSELTFIGSSGQPQNISGVVDGGSVGGLLSFRSEVLDPARNDLGRLATGLAEAVNAQNRLGLDANGDPGQDLFATGAPRVLASAFNGGSITGSPAVTLTDDAPGQLTGADYRMTFDAGANEWQVASRDGDESVAIAEGATGSIGGLQIDTSAVSNPADGDSFALQPTRQAVAGMEVLARDPAAIAAAAPVDGGEVTGAGGGAVNRGTGAIEEVTTTGETNVPFATDVRLTFDSAGDRYAVEVPDGSGGFQALEDDGGNPVFLAYDPAAAGGTTYRGDELAIADPDDNPLAGVAFTLAGAPEDGDRFLLEASTDATGDNRNAQALAGIANEGLLDDGSDSPQAFYSSLVGEIGTETRRAQSGRDAQEQLLSQAESDREAVSGVNLEEEAANLLRFQQGFQAAARATSVANEVFQSLLSAVQR